MTHLEAHIRDSVLRYLTGELTAAQLYGRVPGPWDVDEDAEPRAAELAAFVVGCLAAYQAGDASAGDVEELLAEKLRTVRLETGRPETVVMSAATATFPTGVTATPLLSGAPAVGTPA